MFSNHSVTKLVCIVVLALSLQACASYEYHETKNVVAERYQDGGDVTLSEQELLDVGIVLFDPGVDQLDDESAAYSSVRQSEAVWFASQLKATLEYSNVWGAVRAMPSENTVMDLLLEGKILESNGENVRLQLSVQDASGRLWYLKEYQQKASSYAYNPEVNSNRDPFHSMFVEMANDLFDYRASLESSELLAIRNIAKVRFASEFLPEAYQSYLVEDKGGYALRRIPAANDPMIMRIDRIRARNDLFLDVVQDYYRVFNGNMSHPYQEWRKTSYKEVVYERQLKDQSRKEKIAGVAAILLGVLAQTSSSNSTRMGGHVGIFAGADLIRIGYSKQNEALIHSSTLRELGESLESELEPSVIDLQDRSITLSGTVEDQFQEWQRILREMFLAEGGLPQKLSADITGEEKSTQSATQVLLSSGTETVAHEPNANESENQSQIAE